jgi:hypothetical protein
MLDPFNSKNILFTPGDVMYLLEYYMQLDTSTTYDDILRAMLTYCLVWVSDIKDRI